MPQQLQNIKAVSYMWNTKIYNIKAKQWHSTCTPTTAILVNSATMTTSSVAHAWLLISMTCSHALPRTPSSWLSSSPVTFVWWHSGFEPVPYRFPLRRALNFFSKKSTDWLISCSNICWYITNEKRVRNLVVCYIQPNCPAFLEEWACKWRD